MKRPPGGYPGVPCRYPGVPCRYVLQKFRPFQGSRPWFEMPDGTKMERYYVLPSAPDVPLEDGPQPGDVFYDGRPDGYPLERWHTCAWDNCDHKSLVAILPNGFEWTIDSRCHNCATAHTAAGSEAAILPKAPSTSARAAPTCPAGAGSVHSAQGTEYEYHGHLQGFALTPG